MPAVTADTLTLPRLPRLPEATTAWRGVRRVVRARRFPVSKPRTAADTVLLSSDDGGALVRVISGDVAGHQGPGMTHTPITYLHATLSPHAHLTLPWPEDFTAMVYVLSGRGTVGPDHRPLEEGQLAVFEGNGAALTMRADTAWDVLVLGGLPLREPVARYGPFVMNTRAEILQAVEDFQAGRLGVTHVPHVTAADEELS